MDIDKLREEIEYDEGNGEVGPTINSILESQGLQ